ncbi:DUF6894 family protein [Microvirga aerilata]|uniref:DUF6894 family protein n=1 Tax=Microvirga aerilata TaxID=670292 RepID=UPI00362A2767
MSHDTQCGTANLPGLCVETLSYLDQRQSIDLAGIPTCSLAGLQNHQPEEDPVPCFYFDVREGTKLTVDDEGLEFDSLDAAEDGAISAAADIWRDLLRGRPACRYGRGSERTRPVGADCLGSNGKPPGGASTGAPMCMQECSAQLCIMSHVELLRAAFY